MHPTAVRDHVIFPLKDSQSKIQSAEVTKGATQTASVLTVQDLASLQRTHEHVYGEYSSCMCLYDSSYLELTRNTSSV